MADIETDEYKALRLKFEKLRDEQEQLYKPDFEKVFECLSKLDGGQWTEFLTTPTNLSNELPEINRNHINKALSDAGFTDNKAFCEDFIRYNEVFAEGKMIQQKGIIFNLQEVLEQESQKTDTEQEGWQFYPTGIIASPELHPIINEIVANDAENGTGLFSNKTDIEPFDEGLDEYFDCEAYGIKCSLQPYVREIENTGITNLLFSSNGLSFSYALPALKGIVDSIKENSTEPNKVRNYTTQQIKLFDAIPIWGLFYQILILYGLCYWCETVSHKIGEGKDGYNDVKEFWLWVEKLLISKLVDFTYMPFSDGDKEKLKPLCDYLYSTELGRTVQEGIFKDDEPRQPEITLPEELSTSEPKPLPEKLDNPDAKKLFGDIAELGYCEQWGCSYRWISTAALFGYFVEVTSDYLKVRPSNNRVPWKIYKEAFNCSDKMILTAKQAVNDYNNKDLSKPDGYSDILGLCN